MVYHGPLQIATELGSGDRHRSRHYSVNVPYIVMSPKKRAKFDEFTFVILDLQARRDHICNPSYAISKGNPSKLPCISYIWIKFDPPQKTSPVTILERWPWKTGVFFHNVDAWRMTSYPTAWCANLEDDIAVKFLANKKRKGQRKEWLANSTEPTEPNVEIYIIHETNTCPELLTPTNCFGSYSVQILWCSTKKITATSSSTKSSGCFRRDMDGTIRVGNHGFPVIIPLASLLIRP